MTSMNEPMNELSPSLAGEALATVECPPDVSPMNELSPSLAGEAPATVECPPDVSPMNELSLSLAGEAPTTVECPPDVSPMNELSPSLAGEASNAPTSLTCGIFYSKKRNTEKVKTDSCANKSNSRHSERKTCRPKRYQ